MDIDFRLSRYIIIFWALFLLIQTLFKWVGCLKQFEPIFWCLDNFAISASYFTHIPTQNLYQGTLSCIYH